MFRSDRFAVNNKCKSSAVLVNDMAYTLQIYILVEFRLKIILVPFC